MTDKLALMGSPDEVIGGLLEVDRTVGAIGVVLSEFEDDFNQNIEWDCPPLLLVCYRKLPPTDLADQMKEDGLMGMMLGVTVLNVPEEILTAAPLYQVLNGLAQALTEEHSLAQKALLDDGNDLVAWIVVCEAWQTNVTKEQFDDPDRLPPSKDPNRVEVRMTQAVDRAGYRYTISRERVSGSLKMYADNGRIEEGDEGLTGRLFDALVALMEATPETIESVTSPSRCARPAGSSTTETGSRSGCVTLPWSGAACARRSTLMASTSGATRRPCHSRPTEGLTMIDTDEGTTDFLNSLFNAGLVAGTMLRHGMHPEPILDAKGNYTNRISIPIFENEGVNELRVIVTVQGALDASSQPTTTLPSVR